MNLKSINKKISRLITRIEKDTKKLAKLRSKRDAAPKQKKSEKKKKNKEGKQKNVSQTATAKTATPKTKKARKKPNISPERRAQLAEAMKARWAAKRAAAASSGATSNSTAGS